MPRIQFTRGLARSRRDPDLQPAHAGSVSPANDEPETQHLRAEVARLQDAVADLTLLVDLTREIGVAQGSATIMDTIIRRCVQAAHAEQAFITLVDRNAGGIEHTLVRTRDDSGQRPRFHLMAVVEMWMQLHKEPLLSNDIQNDPRLRLTAVSPCGELSSLLCLPLLHHGKLIGVLSACNSRRAGGFSADDQRLLAIIAGQSAHIIEDARLHEEEERLEKMHEQLRLAREIQEALLPRVAPDLPGYDVAGISIPAGTMGGDYYDYFRLDPHRWVLWLGDVSGKGLPASLLMANLQGVLRGQISSDRKLSRSMRLAGRVLFQSTEADKFSTVFCCILDTRDHTLTYCNAGHDHPFHLGRGERPARLGVGGIVLGAFEDFPYQQETVTVADGDLLVAYSDGITDAENVWGQPFSEERLANVLAGCRHEAARAIAETVLRTVAAHVGEAPPLDDMTVVVLKRRE